jgi:hypothetical protein
VTILDLANGAGVVADLAAVGRKGMVSMQLLHRCLWVLADGCQVARWMGFGIFAIC